MHLEGLIRSVGLLSTFHQALGHARLAELRHALQAAQAVQTSGTGKDVLGNAWKIKVDVLR